MSVHRTHYSHSRWRRDNSCGLELCDETSSTDWTSGLWSLFFGDASYKWSVNIVEKFGGISVPNWGDFCDFKSPQEFPPAERYGARADTRGASGLRREELRQRNFTRNRGTRSGIPVSSKSEQRSSCWNLRGNLQEWKASGWWRLGECAPVISCDFD